ncbi:MAG: diguanylate cyclase [Deinococcus-Thermus bacterium]|jgi:diguanylate cyclase (GGDEF)-like protein|nr:diguanylate cyclase [Deinococcota bacterium]
MSDEGHGDRPAPAQVAPTLRDPETGLAAPPLLRELLQHEMERARRDAHGLGVIRLDLGVPSLAGSAATRDEDRPAVPAPVIREAARRLGWLVRSDEVLARSGGARFVLVVRGSTSVETVARRVLSAFDSPLSVEGRSVSLRARVGLARWPEHGEDADSLLAAAASAVEVAGRPGAPALAVYAPDEPGRRA